MLEIEEGRSFRYGVLRVVPVDTMLVGQSVFYPTENKREIRNIQNQLYTINATACKRFKTLAVEGGLRIWRVQ